MLQVDRNYLALRADLIWVDVGALRQARPHRPEGLALYRPSFLDDLNGLDPSFDRWLSAERQRLVLLARGLAETALGEAAEPSEVLAAAEQLLGVDPAHEGAWRAVMQSYGHAGDRTAAADAFARCKAALAEHAGLEPSSETLNLARALREDRAIACDVVSVRGSDREVRIVASASARARTEPGTRIRVGIMPPRALDPNRVDELSLGLAEEITTALAPFRWISCVSSPSLAAIAAESRDASLAWRSLKLDFLLEGTIQRGPHGVRIMARLLDMHAADEVIWAHRFDRAVDDILALQDEIASAIVAQIAPELLLREGKRAVARRRADPTSHDLMLRAIPAIYRLDQADFRAAGQMLEEALLLDPGNAPAHAWLAHWHIFLVGQGWAEDTGVAIRQACMLAERAVTLDPGDARALTLAGHVRGFLDDKAQEGRALHERALAINPNLALAWCLSGLAHCYLGELDEAIRRINQAQILSPYDPHGFFFDMALTMPYLLRHEYKMAAEIGRRAIELNPIFSSSYKVLLAALGHLGREAEAHAVRARLLDLEPGFTISDALRRSPLTREQDLGHYAEGLRLAGLAENAVAPASPALPLLRYRPARRSSRTAGR
ncbi:MAG: BTAD domain-containing putative transcriptional regulator [Acetobacteraceae bacterium]